MRTMLAIAVVLTSACSSEPAAPRQRTDSAAALPAQPSAGSGGDAEPSDFGNASPSAPIADAGRVVTTPTVRRDCNPGFYLGTYSCEISLFGLPLPLTGDVSFNLSVNESVVERECEPSDEFCADLVIAENSGTLFGLAGLIGFETMLDGALDCTTGEFRATGLGGRYGSPISTNPNDPDALWTVQDPPAGMFEGDLSGVHASAPVEAIEGTWSLVETVSAVACNGPFRVELQP